MSAKPKFNLAMGVGALLVATQASAGPIQVLLDEDFQDVTGLINANSVRTVQHILTNDPGQLSGSPVTAFTNVGSGNASDDSFNVRRGDNPIDGTSGPPTLGNTNFDNFFGGSTSQFLVMGDNIGNLSNTPNGGSGASSSTMSIRFALNPITLIDPRWLTVAFDYVFDANNTANPDDFVAELVLADMSTYNLLNYTAPTAATRGAYSSTILLSSLNAAPTHLNFRLVEYGGGGSSAVGLDNLKVTAIPEPGVLALLGLGLLGLGLARRRG